jgi:hypothetical protein
VGTRKPGGRNLSAPPSAERAAAVSSGGSFGAAASRPVILIETLRSDIGAPPRPSSALAARFCADPTACPYSLPGRPRAGADQAGAIEHCRAPAVGVIDEDPNPHFRATAPIASVS